MAKNRPLLSSRVHPIVMSNAFEGILSKKRAYATAAAQPKKAAGSAKAAAAPRATGAVLPGQRNSATILASSAVFKKQFNELQPNRSTGIFASSVQVNVPDSFDGREAWKKYLAPVRNQGKCGACWAFASTTVLQTRLAIATNGEYNLILCPAKMVLCNLGSVKEYEIAKESIDKGEPYDYNLPTQIATRLQKQKESVASVGCNGETMIGAWQFLYRFGVPEESCMTYEDTSGDGVDLFNYVSGQDLPICSQLISDTYDKCPTDHRPMELHLSEGFYHVPGTMNKDPKNNPNMASGTEFDIRRDIYHWGPVTSGFSVYEDFLSWDGKGIYKWDGKSAPAGGHAIVIVGWGTEAGVPYWIVRNSWGPEWGDKGYFKILRGSNHCEIEDNVIVGLPNLYGFRLFLEWPLLHRSEDLSLRAMWGVRPSGYKTTTFEEMTMGLIEPDLKIIKYQYRPSSWPDVSVFIAAEQDTHVYRISEYYNPRRHPYNFISFGNNAEYFIGGAAGFVIALAGVGLFFFVRHLARRGKKGKVPLALPASLAAPSLPTIAPQ